MKKITDTTLFRWVPKHRDCSVVSQPDEKCASSSFHFGRQFYTPDDISVRELIPNDRPYAGWRYVGGTWRSTTQNTLIATDTLLGFTGRPSFARQVQTQWHKLVNATKPVGWDNQIGDRFGIAVVHTRSRAFDLTNSAKRRWLEAVPYVGGTAGNIVTDAYGGARLKIGLNLSRDWMHNGIQPVVSRARERVHEGIVECYLSGDAQGRLLLYNAFIDAAPQRQLDRRYLVADGGVGVGLRVWRVTASYRIAFVTKEYEQARRFHEFKSLKFMFVLR